MERVPWRRHKYWCSTRHKRPTLPGSTSPSDSRGRLEPATRGRRRRVAIHLGGTGQLLKFFPTFFRHIGGIFSKRRSFQGCHVEVLDDHDGSQEVFLGPFCQCKADFEWHNRAWDALGVGRPIPPQERRRTTATINVPLWVAGAPPPGVYLGRKQRTIRVPVWVAAPSLDSTALPADLCDIQPRCSFHPIAGQAPPSLAGRKGMFSRHCRVHRQTFLLDLEAQAACKDVGAFLQAVQV